MRLCGELWCEGCVEEEFVLFVKYWGVSGIFCIFVVAERGITTDARGGVDSAKRIVMWNCLERRWSARDL